MTSLKLDNKTIQFPKQKSIKCVVWDLDNTLWQGVLLEDSQVELRNNIVEIIKTLDSRGILQSIASKNEHSYAISKLKDLKLDNYFLYPQINWNSKVSSLQNIAKALNISTDTIAFIDDQPFELEEVKFSLPEVLVIDAANLQQVLDMPEMNPRFITEDSQKRRLMYIQDQERKKIEQEFVGSQEEFLATLDLHFTIASAQKEDLQRAEELTLRTNQLNSTGYTYSYDELNEFRCSKDHKLLVASLKDKLGSYGKIGIALVECQEHLWTIKLLLMSCRVMSRGVGSVMLNYIIKQAKENNVRLCADFVTNKRNRMMYITYKFAGFQEITKQGELAVLENKLMRTQPWPEYMKLSIE